MRNFAMGRFLLSLAFFIAPITAQASDANVTSFVGAGVLEEIDGTELTYTVEMDVTKVEDSRYNIQETFSINEVAEVNEPVKQYNYFIGLGKGRKFSVQMGDKIGYGFCFYNETEKKKYCHMSIDLNSMVFERSFVMDTETLDIKRMGSKNYRDGSIAVFQDNLTKVETKK